MMSGKLIKIYNTKNGTSYTEYDNNACYQGIADLTEIPLTHLRYLHIENATRLIEKVCGKKIPKDQLCAMIDDETTLDDIGPGGIVVGIVDEEIIPKLKWSSKIINITTRRDIDYLPSGINLND